MRLALAQMNSIVGDLDGNRERILERLTAGARGRAPTSCSSPSSPSPATRPRTCCSGRRSSAPRGGSSRSSPRRPTARPRSSARPTSTPISTTRPTCSPTARSRRSTASASSRTTASSTRTATSPPASDLLLLRFGEVVVGPTICEDIWQPGPPATDLALAGAQLLVNISASPFHVGKDREREEMLRVRARDNACFVALCNMVGAQDELVFDGQLGRPRRRGRARRPGGELRGGAARRRPRPGRDGRAPAPRRPPPGARARARRVGADGRGAAAAAAPPEPTRCTRGRPGRSTTTSSRCAARSSSGCATTSSRTASPRSWSASPAGSTRR